MGRDEEHTELRQSPSQHRCASQSKYSKDKQARQRTGREGHSEGKLRPQPRDPTGSDPHVSREALSQLPPPPEPWWSREEQGGAGGVEKLACCSSSRRIWHGLGVGVECPGPILSPIPAPAALPLTEGEPCHALLRHRQCTQLPALQAEGAQALCTRGKEGRPPALLDRAGDPGHTTRRLPLVEITSTHRTQVQRRSLRASVLEVTLTAASIKITCQKERMNDRQTTSY